MSYQPRYTSQKVLTEFIFRDLEKTVLLTMQQLLSVQQTEDMDLSSYYDRIRTNNFTQEELNKIINFSFNFDLLNYNLVTTIANTFCQYDINLPPEELSKIIEYSLGYINKRQEKGSRRAFIIIDLLDISEEEKDNSLLLKDENGKIFVNKKLLEENTELFLKLKSCVLSEAVNIYTYLQNNLKDKKKVFLMIIGKS